ncbi:MAG TPA: hypothetical protein VGM63_12860 [Mucilaginibacter sp.]
MLKSELYELEKSVGAILIVDNVTNLSSYRKKVAGQVAHIQNICADLKRKWTHELLSSAKEQVIQRYVQFHQAGIIKLSNEVSRIVPDLNITDEISPITTEYFNQVNAVLENVLEFLRRQFYKYFDIDHQATTYHCQLLRSKIAAFEPELKVYSNPAVDNSLITCVLTSVDDIVAEGSISGISYRQADQCLNLIRIIHQLLLFGSNTTTENLARALYQQNLNSLHFFDWYQDYFSALLNKLTDKKERSDFIGETVRTFAGIFVNPEKALQPELPATDNYIIPWLQEQTGAGKETKKVKPSIQFPLNLSVPQFALFIRIFYKAGCFPVENVAMITRFFTEHFTTKKQSHISHKSFGRAFYSLDQSAAAVVRDFLQKMINYLNKTYFP